MDKSSSLHVKSQRKYITKVMQYKLQKNFQTSVKQQMFECITVCDFEESFPENSITAKSKSDSSISEILHCWYGTLFAEIKRFYVIALQSLIIPSNIL